MGLNRNTLGSTYWLVVSGSGELRVWQFVASLAVCRTPARNAGLVAVAAAVVVAEYGFGDDDGGAAAVFVADDRRLSWSCGDQGESQGGEGGEYFGGVWHLYSPGVYPAPMWPGLTGRIADHGCWRCAGWNRFIAVGVATLLLL